MKKLLFILFLLVTTVTFSQEEKIESPKITIKLALGETIIINNHQLKFVKVLEDSRCPKGVTCIWAGRAKVQVEVWENSEDSIIKELVFGKVNQGESKGLILLTSEGKTIKGYALKPYPSVEVSSSEREYVLLITEEKK